jgi:acetate kinase
MLILTLNAGSSSIKYKVFDQATPLLSGLIEGIGESTGAWHHHYQIKNTQTQTFQTHQQAFVALADKLKLDLQDRKIMGVGHRVVHGGDKFYQPTLITPEVLAEIKNLARLAPLPNPVNALGIEYAQQHFKEAIHVAVFDSGFHHSMPDYVRHYAIARDVAEQYQIKHYGFHGINHEYVARTAAEYLKKPLASCNLISLHLGNGASSCLIKQGKSVDTSMGMTPLAGLIMGTRCGDVDPAIPTYLIQQGLTATEVDNLLNKKSGLKGIANDNDMRNILAAVEANDEQAILAVKMYVYAIQKMIGAYLSQIQTLDALIFTGGVGENSAIIRDHILQPLQHFGFHLDTERNEARDPRACYPISNQDKLILVIRSDEESLIAQDVVEVARALYNFSRKH